MSEHITLFCTCPDEESSALISRSLLEKRLCACVTQIKHCLSRYRWQGEIRQDNEILLMIKTTQTHFAAIEEQIKQLHPYDVPEIIALPVINGSNDYLNWLDKAVEEQ